MSELTKVSLIIETRLDEKFERQRIVEQQLNSISIIVPLVPVVSFFGRFFVSFLKSQDLSSRIPCR